MYIAWPSLMMHCKAVFELFQKLHIDIINYSALICPFESGKCLDEIKIVFYSFWKAII